MYTDNDFSLQIGFVSGIPTIRLPRIHKSGIKDNNSSIFNDRVLILMCIFMYMYDFSYTAMMA